MSEEVKPRRDGGRRGEVSLAGNHLTTVSGRFLSYVSARGLSHASDTTFRVAKGPESIDCSRFLGPGPSKEGVNWFQTGAATVLPPPPQERLLSHADSRDV